MADEPDAAAPKRPPTYQELVELVGELTTEVQRQQQRIGSLQALLLARENELMQATRKQVPLIKMDPKATDKFRRPY